MVQPYGKIKTSASASSLRQKSREQEYKQNLSGARQEVETLNRITSFATLKMMRATLDETTPQDIEARAKDPLLHEAIAKTGFGQSLENLKQSQA